MKPTRLYLKIHTVTGLMYFGKTIKDPYKYLGSGKYWTKHIIKYGKEFVETLWVSDIYIDEETIKKDALALSTEFAIGTDKVSFANLIPENGINGGGDCSQMHTPGILEKIKQNTFNKYGVDHIFKLPSIREKAKNAIIEKYGQTSSQLLNSEQSIANRNNTNLVKYGSKCAANKDGNPNSREVQKNRLNRIVVKNIKCVAAINNYKLARGWYYKSDDTLSELYEDIKAIKPNINSKDIRDKKLTLKVVIILRMVNAIQPLKLGINWFQKPESEIISIYENLKNIFQEDFDIALQTYRQYLEEVV